MNVGRYLRGECQHVGTARTTNIKDIKMSEPKLIKVKIAEIDEHILLDSSIDQAIKHLENIKEIYTNDGFQDLELETHSYGYDGAFEILLYGKRFETERELADRLKKEKKELELKQKADAKKEAEDLKLYKKLQKKFGKLA